MSHPQPPFGPQDPNQQPAEPPTQAFPTAPMPPVPGNPYPPQPPVPGAPYPPPGGPYPPTPGQPFAAPPAKKSNKNVWTIVGIVAVVLLLLCCGGGTFAVYNGLAKAKEAVESLPTADPFDDTPTGGTQPTPETGQTDGETFNMKPGETLVVNDDDGTVEITVSNFRTKNKACQPYMPGPKQGMFLIADVTAEVTKGTGSINPFFFRWVGADSNEKDNLVATFSGCGKLLGSGNNLATGSKRTGQLVFDVKDKNGTVEYAHLLKTAGSWRP